MRASDIVKGKDPALKLKEKEERPLEPIKGANDSEKEGRETTYRLTAMEDELSFKPLSQGQEGHEAAEESTASEDSASERVEDSSEQVEGKYEDVWPKVERVEPSYRLSDTDFLNLMSSPKRSVPAEKEAIFPEQDAIGPSLDDVREAEEAVGLSPEGDPDGAVATPAVALEHGNQEAADANRAPSRVVKDESLPAETQESESVPGPISAAVSAAEEAVEQSCVAEIVITEDEIPENEVEALYMQARSYLKAVREKLRRNEVIDIKPAVGIIRSIIGIHYDMDSEVYQLTVKFGHDEDYFFSHAVNTAIYSLKIGQRLRYAERSLLELGLAALLCDIGMFRIPPDVLNKQGKLSSAEIDLIKSHPRLSRDALIPIQEEFPAVVDAIYKHQERENGQGYPEGLRGDEIPEYSKIIGICDSYEAMTHNRPHKKALMQTESIRELIGAKNQLFSPKIVKAFLDEISIFPVGSYVRLNNRNIGRVVATNRSNPLKPTIKILCDENGQKFSEPRIIDLKANPILNIEGSVSSEEVPL